jgi:hypothetical protein
LDSLTVSIPDVSATQKAHLQVLIEDYGLSLGTGDVQLLDGKCYVTHSGLLRIALKNHCSGIHTETISEFCSPAANRWVVKATVFKTPRSKGFVGYGDADPSNVSLLVRGAEMRIAETRAVNRALRKAYGIGLCSVEEIGTLPRPLAPSAAHAATTEPKPQNGRLLRDRLRLLIRQHQLDAGAVKRYAASFCGTKELREATRDQVDKFVNHLAQVGQEGPERLAEVLAPYAAEVQSKEPAPVQNSRAEHAERNPEAA